MPQTERLTDSVLGYSPQMRILNYLLDFPTNDFTKKEIIQALGMSSRPSTSILAIWKDQK
jgi:hypothetical protein